MTDEEVIAEFRSRLLAGRYGDRQLLMPADRDYSGMWGALCEFQSMMEDGIGYNHPIVRGYREHINYLADRRPSAVEIFALATARYGREDMEGA